MKHLGNLCDLCGWAVPPVDILTGGSPCQNLSVAGNRKGLAGNESGLFLEQIRLFKEMRDASAATGSLRRPRFFVWENVKGAFSCNGGEDFRRVLEEVVRIAEPDAVVPRPPREEGWTPAGAILGDGWSLAWRLHDAQFWGVPQRRARIALVADFGGQSAPEILFERKGVQGDFGAGEEAGQGAAGGAGESAAGASISFVERMGKPGGGKGLLIRDEQAGTLDTGNTQAICAIFDARGNGDGKTVSTLAGDHENRITDYTSIVLNDQGGGRMDVSKDKTQALRSNMKPHEPIVAVDIGGGKSSCGVSSEVSPTLATTNGGEPAVAFADVADPFAFAQNQRDELRDLGDVSGSLAAEPGMKQQTYVAEPVAYSIGNGQAAQAGLNEKCYALDTMHDAQAVFSSHILRRLTPLECTRLQGFPDGWVDIGDWEDTKGRLHKEADAPKYKALGNSIAIPFWEWMARRMVAVLKRDGVEHPTMCSLFDGIGGFPLSFERAGCEPVWASEIEEFPIAVTKRHFPEPEGAEEAKSNYQPKEAFDDCLDR